MKFSKKTTLHYLYYFILIAALASCEENGNEEEFTPEIDLQNIDTQYIGAGIAQNCGSEGFRFVYNLSYSSNVDIEEYNVILLFDNVYEKGDTGKFITDRIQIENSNTIETSLCIVFLSDQYVDNILKIALLDPLNDEDTVAISNPEVVRVHKPS